MKLPDYKDFDAKKKVFHHDIIDTVEKFDSWLFAFESLEPVIELKLIYRGLNEAKFKNYTSSQRDWITKEWAKVLSISYVDYVDNLLEQIRKDSILSTYFFSLGIMPNDVLYLSFMQHYGMPSPLLDFTKDLRTALYYAMDGMKSDPSSVEIENYFSLYVIMPSNEYAPVDVLFSEGIHRSIEVLDDFKKDHPVAKVNDDLLKDIDLLTKWKETNNPTTGLHNIPIMYIPNPLDANPVVNLSGQKLLWSNPNIIAQKGCFIMNSSETDTLEDFVSKNKYTHPIMCIDIHKSLSEHIKQKYTNNLTQENIYPKFKKIADKAYADFKSRLD